MREGTFSMTSEPAELARLRAWLRGELDGEEVPREARAGLLVAVGELCTNAIKHAYEGRAGQPIRVRLRATDDRLLIEVEDWGKPFDASRYVDPDLEALPERGLGLFLARTVADTLSWDVERERGTRWTLIKYLPGRGPAAGTAPAGAGTSS